MILEFIESWPLFHDAYLSGLLIAALLGLVGVAVVARDQIFIGAAVSQASMFGIAFGIRAGDPLAHRLSERALDIMHSVTGGAAAVLGAWLTGVTAATRDTRESMTGWVFLVGASLSVLVVAHSPHGLAEVNRLAASTIIGAHGTDVVLFVALLVVTIGVLAARRDAILLMLVDSEMARATGVPVRIWDRLLAIWLGLTVACSIHVAGMLYTFGCLVLPGLAARNLCRELTAMLFVAPVLGVSVCLIGFVVANGLDYPPAQVAVALMSALLVASWGIRSLRG
ncbi:MAG: metal ABC transporter permease [Myxococcales bacterium]|jgi:zinc transport system permease protein|nr:MAG: metal ABC transporter permease [Myxococcales bacterium]